MARLIPARGVMLTIKPANGREFTLEEMQKYVGGYVEEIRGLKGEIILADEDGLAKRLCPNIEASEIAGRWIVGDVLIVEPTEIS